MVAGGSDAPIEIPNPFVGMHAAIFRPVPLESHTESKSSSSDKSDSAATKFRSWHDKECLSKQQALELWTSNAAYTARAESRLGRLSKGFLADFVVVNEDVWVHPERLNAPSVKPLQVWVAGVRRL